MVTTQGRLREHFKWSKDPKVAKAGIAKGRLRAAIVPVVALVKRHGKELRRLLRMDDEERAEVPTVMQENATLKRRVDEAQQAAEAEKKRRKVEENKVSQYGRRLKSKQKAVSDARKAWAKKTAKEKAEEREKRKQQVKEWREKNVTRLQEQATKGAWKDVQGKVDDIKKEFAREKGKNSSKNTPFLWPIIGGASVILALVCVLLGFNLGATNKKKGIDPSLLPEGYNHAYYFSQLQEDGSVIIDYKEYNSKEGSKVLLEMRFSADSEYVLEGNHLKVLSPLNRD